MTNAHLTNEQLQLLVDSALSPDETAIAKEHLQSCRQCNAGFVSLSNVHSVLRVLPLEKPSSNFTHSVLMRLNIAPKTSILFRIVENLAYVFGLMIVLGIMLTVFLVTGVISKGQVVETQSTMSNAGRIVGQQLETMTSWLTAFLQTYLPFMFGSGSMRIALMSLVAIAMLAVFDRFLKRRFHM